MIANNHLLFEQKVGLWVSTLTKNVVWLMNLQNDVDDNQFLDE